MGLVLQHVGPVLIRPGNLVFFVFQPFVKGIFIVVKIEFAVGDEPVIWPW